MQKEKDGPQFLFLTEEVLVTCLFATEVVMDSWCYSFNLAKALALAFNSKRSTGANSELSHQSVRAFFAIAFSVGTYRAMSCFV